MKTETYYEECEFIRSLILMAYDKYKDCRNRSFIEKRAFDIVTTIDYGIEQFIIDRIHEKYSSDLILSEEMNSDTVIKGRTWTIDPIDGTYNYANGIPLFGLQCSMIENENVVVCAIYLPYTNEMYHAIKGAGAFLNNKRIYTRNSTLEKCIVSFGDFPHSRPDDMTAQLKMMSRIYSKIARIRMFGAASIDFAYLASGKTDGVIIFTRNKWDLLPGMLLCNEAGAVLKGEKGKYNGDSRVVIAVSSTELMDCIMEENYIYQDSDV